MCLVSMKTVLWKMDSVLIVLLDLTGNLTAMEPVKVCNLRFCFKVRLDHSFFTNI